LIRIYFVHSATQLNPRLWLSLGHPYIMVSADNIAENTEHAAKELRGLSVIVDSGGYRLISRGKLPDPSTVISVQKTLSEEIGALPVLLDTPVPDPLRASDSDFYAANKLTARNARVWSRVFGDRFLYPLHARTPSQLREALRIARSVAPSVDVYGLGSLAPLARYRPEKLLELVMFARELVEQRLHVLGVGNSVAAAINLLGIADSIDTSSPLSDARYGLARVPSNYALALLAPRRNKPAAPPETVSSQCNCPVCRKDPRALAGWGRRGVLARTIHNAYQLLRALSNPVESMKLISRNKRLLRAVRRMLKHRYEAGVVAAAPQGLCKGPGIGVDMIP